MGEVTGIQWCDHTFNPWWGCQRVSPACENCYAETFAKRVGFGGPSGKPLLWGPGSDRRFFGEKHWKEPLKWNAAAKREGVRRRVFCASMADVFEDRPDLGSPDGCLGPRAQLFATIAVTDHLDWLLLTKRPENIARMVPWGERGTHRADPACWRNVWLGTTVEDERRADGRIPLLVDVPASRHFISYEPALESVDFSPYLRHLDWIIIGGESGPQARHFDPNWARSLVSQCRSARVAPFIKQMGRRILGDHGDHHGFLVNRWILEDGSEWVPPLIGEHAFDRPANAAGFVLFDPHGGDWNEWPEDLRIREFPTPETP